MAMTGTTIFSHIIPVMFGFFGIILISTGIMDDKKISFGAGITLFVVGCILPFLVLNALL